MNIAPSWVFGYNKMRQSKRAFHSGSSKSGRHLIFSSALLFFFFFALYLSQNYEAFLWLVTFMNFNIIFIFYYACAGADGKAKWKKKINELLCFAFQSPRRATERRRRSSAKFWYDKNQIMHRSLFAFLGFPKQGKAYIFTSVNIEHGLKKKKKNKSEG